MKGILKIPKARMRSQCWCALGLVLLSASFSPWGRERLLGQEVPIQDFIDLLEDATAAQDRHFENIGIRIKYNKVYEPSAKGASRKEERIEFEFRARKRLLRLTTIDYGVDPPRKKTDLVNDQGWFRLEPVDGQAENKVVGFLDDRAEGFERIMDTAKIARAACYYYNSPFSEWYRLRSKVFKVINDGGLYKTAYKVPDTSTSGELVFRSLGTMCLVEHRRFAPNEEEFLWREKVTYEGESERTPLVKRVEIAVRDPTGTVKEVWEVLEWIPGPFPPSDFALENFGVTDFVHPGHTPLWYSIVAVLLFFVFIGAIEFRRRRNRSAQKGPSVGGNPENS